MKKITTLFLAMVCVAISAQATVTINVRTSDGEPPYLYTWGGANNGEWPGTQMDAESTITTEDGLVWFTQEFDCDALNLIFNDGNDPAIQTTNINGVTGTAYYIFDPEEGEYEDVTSTYVEIHEFDPASLPSSVVWIEGDEFAYFVAPASWIKCCCWAWNNTTNTNFTGGTWPGFVCESVGSTTDGAPVFLWHGPLIDPEDRPQGIIFSNGSGTQTADMVYVPGGVYDLTGKLLYTVPGGSEPLVGDVNSDGSVNAADVTALYNYILNGDMTYYSTSDVNNDDAVNAGDVTAVYNIILGSVE